MTKSRVGRRPDGPEDANPMNRRLPAEVVSRRKGNEQRVGPGKGTKEEAAPSNVSTDLKQVLAMKPDSRVKWLARAVQQAHPQDGRLAPKTIYDIIAHAKFANDVSEKAGQRMYRVVHANLSLFSTRQQKFLEKECALAKQFAASAFAAAQTEDEDKAAATMEDMMARCRAFVRERQSERGERNDKEGNEEGEQEDAEAGLEPADLQPQTELPEPSLQDAVDVKVSVNPADGVPAREASKSRSDGGNHEDPGQVAEASAEPLEKKPPVKIKGTIAEKIAEAAKAEDEKEQEREAKTKKDKVKGKVKGKADKNGLKDRDGSGEDKAKKVKAKDKDKKSKHDRKRHGRRSTASSSYSDRDRSKSRSRSHRREAKRSGKAKGKSHHSSDSSGRKRARSASSSRSHGKRRK